MAAAVAGLWSAMPAETRAWRALPALPWRAHRAAAARFYSSVVGRGRRAAPGAGNSSVQRPSWNSLRHLSTSRLMAVPLWRPGRAVVGPDGSEEGAGG
eukprot:15212353-Alexandrium_andersonii.AAC.1